jgi:O-antigen biosynthesis protein WbqV
MGQAVRILDLARNMITLAGRRPEIDIPIIFTGLRPGEKLFEEVLTEDEHVRPTPAKKVHRIARTETPLPELDRTIDELAAAALREDDAALRERLRRFVPDFRA